MEHLRVLGSVTEKMKKFYKIDTCLLKNHTRAQCYKSHYVCNLLIFVIKSVLVLGKPFQPSLMFEGEAGAYPSGVSDLTHKN